MALGQNKPNPHRHAIPIPGSHQEPEAQTKKPGMILAGPSFLCHRVLGAAFVGVAAIAKEIQNAIGRWGQGGQQVLRQPVDEQMHVPIDGFEQTAKAPRGDARWRPPGHLFQGMSPRVHGLHEHQPAEDEAMPTAPHRGHAAKDQGHKPREVGKGHQHTQRHLQRRENENSERWNATSPLHLSALICKGLAL